MVEGFYCSGGLERYVYSAAGERHFDANALVAGDCGCLGGAGVK